MATVAKKENLTISIREYQDNQGQTKKVWKTIGELITWDDGKQSFEMWGPTGATKGSVFAQDNQQQAPQQQGFGQPQQGAHFKQNNAGGFQQPNQQQSNPNDHGFDPYNPNG